MDWSLSCILGNTTFFGSLALGRLICVVNNAQSFLMLAIMLFQLRLCAFGFRHHRPLIVDYYRV